MKRKGEIQAARFSYVSSSVVKPQGRARRDFAGTLYDIV